MLESEAEFWRSKGWFVPMLGIGGSVIRIQRIGTATNPYGIPIIVTRWPDGTLVEMPQFDSVTAVVMS